jgi:hypothetical protein
MDTRSLLDLLTVQWTGLCALTGIDPVSSTALLSDLLGPAGAAALPDGPATASEIADDHTPVEFSLAFNHRDRPTLRILGEARGVNDFGAAEAFLVRQAGRPGFAWSRLARVRDLFLPDTPGPDAQGPDARGPDTPGPDPQGPDARGSGFAMWHSLVFRPGKEPEFKIYLNPEAHGPRRAPAVVAEALKRLGVSTVLPTRPADRFVFFALDLHDGPRTRIKVYVAHPGATTGDILRAASAVDGVDPWQAAEFCADAAGRPERFTGRPLVSSFTLTPGQDRPVGYSVYVPIRSYVDDDAEARERIGRLLDRHGFAGADLDRALAAVARRPLDEGVGLLAHASLRLGRPQPGISVYLSAEAYQVSPPRVRQLPSR